MRHVRPIVIAVKIVSPLVLAALAALGCSDAKAPEGPAPSRFASVKKDDTATRKAASTFCELSFTKGEGGRKLADPPERPVAGQERIARTPGAWRWVNLWATWCHPCVEEMGLLTRWRDSLRKDGIALDMEMWSVDDEEAAVTAFLKQHNMPGRVRLLRSANDLGAVLEGIGADKASAIPVHALVDADNNVRCVRVGSVHDEDYGAVKSLLLGG